MNRPGSLRAWRPPTDRDGWRRAPTGTQPTCSGISPRCRCSGARSSATGSRIREPRRGGEARPSRRLRRAARLVRRHVHRADRRGHDDSGRNRGVDVGRRSQRRLRAPSPGARSTDPPARRRAPARRPHRHSTATSRPTVSTRCCGSCTATCPRGPRSPPTARRAWSRRPTPTRTWRLRSAASREPARTPGSSTTWTRSSSSTFPGNRRRSPCAGSAPISTRGCGDGHRSSRSRVDGDRAAFGRLEADRAARDRLGGTGRGRLCRRVREIEVLVEEVPRLGEDLRRGAAGTARDLRRARCGGSPCRRPPSPSPRLPARTSTEPAGSAVPWKKIAGAPPGAGRDRSRSPRATARPRTADENPW